MSCGTCGLQASDTMQGDTGVPAGAPTGSRPRCPRCRAFVSALGAPCTNPRCAVRPAATPAIAPGSPVQGAMPMTRVQAVGTGPSLLAVPGQQRLKEAVALALVGGHSIGVITAGDPATTKQIQRWAKAHGVRMAVVATCPCGQGERHCTCTLNKLLRWRTSAAYRQALASDVLLHTTAPLPAEIEQQEQKNAGWQAAGANPDTEVWDLVATARRRERPPLLLDESTRTIATGSIRQLGLDSLKVQRMLQLAQDYARLAGSDHIRAEHIAGGCLDVRETDTTAYLQQHGLEAAPPLPDIIGQEQAKRVLEVALAGHHSVTLAAVDGPAAVAEANLLAAWGQRHGLRVQVVSPCPCGYFGNLAQPFRCTCGERVVARWQARPEHYLARQSDLRVEVAPASAEAVTAFLSGQRGEPEAALLARVAAAAPPPAPWEPDADGVAALQRAQRELRATAKQMQQLQAVVQTLARLAGAQQVQSNHVAEAVAYATRTLPA